METETANSKPKGWHLGRLLPWGMALLFVADLLLRFAPLDPFVFRAWEAMQRRLPTVIGPFEPGKRFHKDYSYGGVASIGNLRGARLYRPADFMTDALGFHTLPRPAGEPILGLVVGDSYAVGGEVAEDQTLAAQLSREFGGYFYNAGAPQPLQLASIRVLAGRLHLHRGLIVYEFLESRAHEAPPAATPDGARRSSQAWALRLLGPERWDRLRAPLNHFHESPLQMLAVKFEKRLQNGVFLPNSFARFVIRERLRNGDPMVFLPAEFDRVASRDASAEAWASYFAWLVGELRRDGFEFLVLLVPNRSTVYGPLLEKPRAMEDQVRLLRSFEQHIREAGVSAVNITSAYRETAAANLPRRLYLYYQDDTHWDRDAIALAAAQIHDSLLFWQSGLAAAPQK